MTSILQHPHDTLRANADKVEEGEFNTPALKTLVADMQQALEREEDGVALAAPQVNVSKRLFIISPKAYQYAAEEAGAENTEEREVAGPLVFINPEIVKQSRKKTLMSEGCLSVRWQYGEHQRSEKATVRAQDIAGNWFSYNGAGLVAQIFQHEIDHLNGILFIDHARDIEYLPPDDER